MQVYRHRRSRWHCRAGARRLPQRVGTRPARSGALADLRGCHGTVGTGPLRSQRLRIAPLVGSSAPLLPSLPRPIMIPWRDARAPIGLRGPYSRSLRSLRASSHSGLRRAGRHGAAGPAPPCPRPPPTIPRRWPGAAPLKRASGDSVWGLPSALPLPEPLQGSRLPRGVYWGWHPPIPPQQGRVVGGLRKRGPVTKRNSVGV